MLQVKIFSGAQKKVEVEVNDWLEKNGQLEIDQLLQTDCISKGENSESRRFTLTVVYQAE